MCGKVSICRRDIEVSEKDDGNYFVLTYFFILMNNESVLRKIIVFFLFDIVNFDRVIGSHIYKI